MISRDLVDSICALADRNAGQSGVCETGIAGLRVLRSFQPTALQSVLYKRLLCLILQGSKETHLGDRQVSFGAGQSLIVSHDLPVTSRVTKASKHAPYVALILEIDMGVVRSLYDEVEDAGFDERDVQSLEVGGKDAALIDAMGRLFALADQPIEAKVVAPLVTREIHFRLMRAQHGGMLRRLLQRESHPSRIAKVIGRIRQDFAKPLVVADLAREAGMSTSSLHEHFKSITATTPLQYQKELRLLEARTLLVYGRHSVSAAAFEVGYESPTQFSREYSRKFGTTPRADMTMAELAS